MDTTRSSISASDRSRSRGSTASLRTWLVAAASAAFLLAAVVPAIEDASGATQPSATVTPTSVKRGKPITVTGSHWPRRVTVQLLIGPPQSEAEPVARVRTTRSGTFRRTFVPPAFVQARLGRWILLACRRDCRVKAMASFRLTR
jgi:hypothetical protein